MNLNLKLLYDAHGLCRLCSFIGGEHSDECPGTVLEGLIYEITYSGSNCRKGCCGSGEGAVTGKSLEEALDKVIPLVRGFVRFSADARLVYEIPTYITPEINAGVDKLLAEEKAVEDRLAAVWALKAASNAYSSSVQALDAERGDLLPGVYEKRLKNLQDRYAAEGVVFTSTSVEFDPHGKA